LSGQIGAGQRPADGRMAGWYAAMITGARRLRSRAQPCCCRRLCRCARRRYADRVAVEVVRLLRFPGDCRALVSEATAALGERMGEMKRLDVVPDASRPAMRQSPSAALGGTVANMRGYFGDA
jgi:hypothetical protein